MDITVLYTAFLPALNVLTVGMIPTTAAAAEVHSWAIITAITALAGSAFISKKAMRKALRKAAWQQLWHARRRKLSIESPEFLWMAIIIGAVGLLAAIFGLVLLAAITLGCAVLCLIRSFFKRSPNYRWNGIHDVRHGAYKTSPIFLIDPEPSGRTFVVLEQFKEV